MSIAGCFSRNDAKLFSLFASCSLHETRFWRIVKELAKKLQFLCRFLTVEKFPWDTISTDIPLIPEKFHKKHEHRMINNNMDVTEYEYSKLITKINLFDPKRI